MSRRAKVYIQFPKTGLGNMMLVWARGVVFASLNKLEYSNSGWWGFRWGALIRGEQKKRLYWGYFKEPAWLDGLRFKWFGLKNKTVYEPAIKKLSFENRHDTLYIFDKVYSDEALFGPLKEHVSIIQNELYRILDTKMKTLLKGYPVPLVSVHIRRGDFKLSNQTTALSFFLEGIKQVRTGCGKKVPVTIFSDASKDELKDILVLPEVHLAESKPDILDILLMSKSKILMLSKSSTFSYWAAFLSSALVIMKYDDWQEKIKDTGDGYQEIKFNPADEGSCTQLMQMIRKINV